MIDLDDYEEQAWQGDLHMDQQIALVAQLRFARELIAIMWRDADRWHGPVASSHYRIDLMHRAKRAGVNL